MSLTGLVVGWRIRTSVLEAIGGFLLLLLFAYALSWVMAWVGLIVPTPEVVQNASFIVLFPLTFIANTFVPTNDFPTVLRVFAEWNPVSTLTQAARELFGNTSPALPRGRRLVDAAPGRLHAAVGRSASCAVFVPLATRQYAGPPASRRRTAAGGCAQRPPRGRGGSCVAPTCCDSQALSGDTCRQASADAVPHSGSCSHSAGREGVPGGEALVAAAGRRAGGRPGRAWAPARAARR